MFVIINHLFDWIALNSWMVSVLEVTFKEAKTLTNLTGHYHIDGLVQDCNNSIANAQELLQYCTKP